MGQLWAKESEKKRKMRPTLGQKKMSQLWAEMGMGFREYLKCQKKREMVPTMDQKKMSQLWARIIWATWPLLVLFFFFFFFS
jgi:hypothetical protein